jgi:hypothetical protein
MSPLDEWSQANSNRAELIAQLARYAPMDLPTVLELTEQHATTQALYVQVEHIQNMIHKFEGQPYSWNAATSHRNFIKELSKMTIHIRPVAELEVMLAKRKELIRDIVCSLATSITQISIEIKRHKLLALAHMSREIAPLLTPYTSITQQQMQHNMQNQATKAINAPTRV